MYLKAKMSGYHSEYTRRILTLCLIHDCDKRPVMYSTSDKRETLLPLLQQLWWGETWGTHALSRCSFPPDYLRPNNATAAAERYGFQSCTVTPHERRRRMVGGFLWVPSPVISGNQGWVLERNLSHLLSVQLLLLFGGEGQRHSTLMMGGLQLLYVPFTSAWLLCWNSCRAT